MRYEAEIIKSLREKCESPEYMETFIKNYIFSTYKKPRYFSKHRGFDARTGKYTNEPFDVIIEDNEERQTYYVSITSTSTKNLRTYLLSEIEKFSKLENNRKRLFFFTKYLSTEAEAKEILERFADKLTLFYLDDIANDCLNNLEYKHLIYDLLPIIAKIDNLQDADEKFNAVIKGNFLYNFNSEQTDYLELLSSDFKNLFFSFFNRNEQICILGKRGIGKTFNSLLISKKLKEEGYKAFHVSLREISNDNIKEILKSQIINNKFVFILDDCQDNVEKANSIFLIVNRIKNAIARPKLVFLFRTERSNRYITDEIKELFSDAVPFLVFKEKYINFEHLLRLFFSKINKSEMSDTFLSELRENDISNSLFRYRNMELWNIFFKSVEFSGEFSLKEDDFFESTFNYFSKTEPYLITSQDILIKLLPFAKNEICILTDYLDDIIQKDPTLQSQFDNLVKENVFSYQALTWANKSAQFVITTMHSTKAEVIELLLNKYSGLTEPEEVRVLEYLTKYPYHLYYIITPIHFTSPEILKKLLANDSFVYQVKKYFLLNYLGKRLDRVLKTFSSYKGHSIERLIDDEVLDSFADKVHNKEFNYFLVNKFYLFHSLYTFSPQKAYELFKKIDIRILADDFNNDPKGRYSFVKFMEVFKNIYYYADEDEKNEIQNTIKELLNICSPKLIEKLDKDDYFTQFHWFLKRLDGMKLAAYFLEHNISPFKILEWIKNKDVRINELRFVFKNARFITLNGGENQESLYEFFRKNLEHQDIIRIFENPRSRLYDMAITSKFGHEILAEYFYKYSFDSSFTEKVSVENNLYRINESIELIETNSSLPKNQISSIVRRIVETVKINEKLISNTIKDGRKLKKSINIETEKQRFLKYKMEYS